MKPPPFAYEAPATLEEALTLLDERAGDAVVLAGGQSLVPSLNFRLGAPELLVDIGRLPGLAGVEAREGDLRVGALTTHSALISAPTAREHLDALSQAARHIGHTAIRNRGTAGGSLAHADPAAELSAVVAAADGRIELTSRTGTRQVGHDEFVLGPYLTTRRPGELVTALLLPLNPTMRWGVAEVTRRSGDFALAGAVVGISVEDGSVRDARIALFGVEPVPRRLHDAEAALVGTDGSSGGAAAPDSVELELDDPVAEGYRRHLAGVVVDQALERALARVEGAS